MVLPLTVNRKIKFHVKLLFHTVYYDRYVIHSLAFELDFFDYSCICSLYICSL